MKKVTLYQNVYRDKTNRLVYYQQYHESIESALEVFKEKSNGDIPAFIIEVVGIIVHEPKLIE